MMEHRHKHYDLIRQWIEDTSRKVDCRPCNRPDLMWTRVTGTPAWAEDTDYRFVPDVLRYRVALFDTGAQRWTSTTDDPTTAANWEGTRCFVRWIEVTDPPVEKPKPKMKKYERWLNLYPDDTCQVHRAKETADDRADSDRVDCRHIEWEVPA